MQTSYVHAEANGGVVVEVLIAVAAIAIFEFAAIRWGADSRR